MGRRRVGRRLVPAGCQRESSNEDRQNECSLKLSATASFLTHHMHRLVCMCIAAFSDLQGILLLQEARHRAYFL